MSIKPIKLLCKIEKYDFLFPFKAENLRRSNNPDFQQLFIIN
jgi:hypothetical protein